MAATQTFTLGLDISHHQDLGLDLAQCRREGIEFVFLKATEGSRFRDPEFATNLAEARAAGQLVAAYHYMRGDVSALSQVMHITNVVPRDVAVIPDIEAGSGGVDLARQLVNQLRAVGYTVPLTYLPRWYWQQLGSPSLAGLPPLWSSRYPDNVVGSLSSEWADVPATYWNGYGGLDVAVLQFTSSVRIAGHQPIDANAFRGTRTALAALLGYVDTQPSAGYPDKEEDDMVVIMKGDKMPNTYAVKIDPTLKTAEGEPTAALRCYIPEPIGAALLAAGKVITVPQASFDAIAKVEGSA